MPRIHIQVEAPKYDELLPACCTANVHGKTLSVFLWESYISPRTSQVVYLASGEGSYMTIPETAIVENTVKRVCTAKEYLCNKTTK